ncbi:hypothetical protein [Paenibacillus sp. CF384]|uniref:hypothetical protein n=1 Tax=Paenibacillus sp. CF384 TaxID=1884382 RepID=UPI0008999784|nr:hypothetical protein [Paenibacillus sp. CF384]SDX08038.1 hypothetical protein SAMN05518855_1008199 [Paenibacillus sp. CF384]
MKNIRTLLLTVIVVVVSIVLTGCSTDHKSQILGNWISDQASQRAGSDEPLSHFNYLEVKEGQITLGNYVNEMKDDSTVKLVKDSNATMTYEWKSDNEIVINNSIYEIELEHDEMILRNENVEIHYNKTKQ